MGVINAAMDMATRATVVWAAGNIPITGSMATRPCTLPDPP
jgi:hypothetical protein